MATWQDVITAAQTLLQRWKRDVDFTSQIVNGPATGPASVVNTDGGTIPTFAKTLGDAAVESQSLRSDLANATDPAKGAALVGFLQDGSGAVGVTVRDVLRETVSPERYGAVGDGVTLDTVAFTNAIKSNRRLKLTRGKTYLVRLSTIMDVANFELDGNGATIICDQTQSILGFKSLTWGVCKDIYIHDVTIQYSNNPNVRTDNRFCLWFEKVNGVRVERVTVPNSWSAGVIFSQCSNVKAYSNKISNTLADGMTCFGCGRNVSYIDNDFENTGDDAMAVTWLAGNTAADVGESTIRTKGVRLIGNRAKTSTVSARGVFIGGIEDGTISGNQFHDMAAFSILISNTTTVATYSTDIVIDGNVCVNSGQAASSLVGEVGGIAIYSQNLGIKVHGNRIKNANNIGILMQGNADITKNWIDGTTNNPSVQNPSLPWLGAGFASADFSGSNTCYGSFDGNKVWNTRHRAIWIQAGYNTEYLSVCGNEIRNCVDPVAVGTAALGFIYLDSSTRNQVRALRNDIIETRPTQVLQSGVYVAGGGLHDIDFVGLNIASGGTQPSIPISNASGATAINRFLQTTRDPGTIAANSSYTVNLSVADAHLRDQVIITAPYQIPGLILSGFVQSSNTVTMLLTNPTTSSIVTLGSNTYTVRVRRQ